MSVNKDFVSPEYKPLDYKLKETVPSIRNIDLKPIPNISNEGMISRSQTLIDIGDDIIKRKVDYDTLEFETEVEEEFNTFRLKYKDPTSLNSEEKRLAAQGEYEELNKKLQNKLSGFRVGVDKATYDKTFATYNNKLSQSTMAFKGSIAEQEILEQTKRNALLTTRNENAYASQEMAAEGISPADDFNRGEFYSKASKLIANDSLASSFDKIERVINTIRAIDDKALDKDMARIESFNDPQAQIRAMEGSEAYFTSDASVYSAVDSILKNMDEDTKKEIGSGSDPREELYNIIKAQRMDMASKKFNISKKNYLDKQAGQNLEKITKYNNDISDSRNEYIKDITELDNGNTSDVLKKYGMTDYELYGDIGKDKAGEFYMNTHTKEAYKIKDGFTNKDGMFSSETALNSLAGTPMLTKTSSGTIGPHSVSKLLSVSNSVGMSPYMLVSGDKEALNVLSGMSPESYPQFFKNNPNYLKYGELFQEFKGNPEELVKSMALVKNGTKVPDYRIAPGVSKTLQKNMDAVKFKLGINTNERDFDPTGRIELEAVQLFLEKYPNIKNRIVDKSGAYKTPIMAGVLGRVFEGNFEGISKQEAQNSLENFYKQSLLINAPPPKSKIIYNPNTLKSIVGSKYEERNNVIRAKNGAVLNERTMENTRSTAVNNPNARRDVGTDVRINTNGSTVGNYLQNSGYKSSFEQFKEMQKKKTLTNNDNEGYLN